jgi:heme/copper-type cytochrome/quinol oxidase subunit 3
MMVLVLWIKDIVYEGLCGYHNLFVQDGLKMGIILFIFREIIFFFRIFWYFFDAALVPIADIGRV